jgi:ribosomal protein L11
MLKLKNRVTMAIRCQSAESGPPIGTVLGNLGVNSVKFCQQFNEVTSDLPNYLVVRTEIDIFENNSFTFVIKAPSTGFILSLFRQARDFEADEDSDVLRNCIELNDVIQLALFKFPDEPLEQSVKVIFSCVYSSNLLVIDGDEV